MDGCLSYAILKLSYPDLSVTAVPRLTSRQGFGLKSFHDHRRRIKFMAKTHKMPTLSGQFNFLGHFDWESFCGKISKRGCRNGRCNVCGGVARTGQARAKVSTAMPTADASKSIINANERHLLSGYKLIRSRTV